MIVGEPLGDGVGVPVGAGEGVGGGVGFGVGEAPIEPRLPLLPEKRLDEILVF